MSDNEVKSYPYQSDKSPEYEIDRFIKSLEAAPTFYLWKQIEEAIVFYAQQSDVWYTRRVD